MWYNNSSYVKAVVFGIILLIVVAACTPTPDKDKDKGSGKFSGVKLKLSLDLTSTLSLGKKTEKTAGKSCCGCASLQTTRGMKYSELITRLREFSRLYFYVLFRWLYLEGDFPFL